jgi:serine/threonine protein phosphatase 1
MDRLLAISDIHGCFDAFYNLVIRDIKISKTDKLVLLGDYIDRGPQSKEVIDFIRELMDTGFNVIPLAGNHEVMLIDALKNDNMLPLWLLNEGMSTLHSFGVHDISEIEKKYLDFFEKLNYFEEKDKFLFVHAGFNDFAPDPFGDIHGMIWESYPVYNNPLLRDKTIIHGHRPKKIEHIMKLLSENSKVIPIDTGCVYEKEDGFGILSALDVGNMKLISVENNSLYSN